MSEGMKDNILEEEVEYQIESLTICQRRRSSVIMKKQLCTGEGQCQQEEMTADYREGGMSEKSNDIMLE